ncbi:MAG: anthranilate synthase component I family protein [Deltaproteobacteria bacterium]|nr:anthranilate synthase component I family protein [Deltaproteobacteria bacterium]
MTTAIGLAARLAGCRGRVLLDSASDADGQGGASFVAARPLASLCARGDALELRDVDGAIVRAWRGDPIAAAEDFAIAHGADLRADADGEPVPRVIGWFGYELGAAIVGVAPRADRDITDTNEIDVPDLWLAAYGAVARVRAGEVAILGDDPESRAWLTTRLTEDRLSSSPAAPPQLGALTAPDDPDGAAHRARVARIRDYLRAGDAYQVNLARRLIAPVARAGDPLAVYAALATSAPAPFGALIEADGATLLSGSPERFLSLRPRGRIETRPIKGTRPRAADPDRDRALAAELAVAEKDGAEHLMIVDLERNDLGRVAVTGSVSVDALAYVVELPGLHHLVSRVSAELRPDIGLAALLRATFPGGSITGAPKRRAMQIIDELEPVRRGPYCGAFGWLAPGALELAIAIRVAVVTDRDLRVHVGGGIVIDSDPAAELAETEVKAAGWRRALAALAGQSVSRDPCQ